MKVVMAVAPDRFLEERRRKGIDKWDEMWQGVLHMPPMPNRDHQELEWALETWLRRFWCPASGGRVFHQINVAAPGGWPDHDYRIPDIVLLAPDRFHIDQNEYFDGGPSVVVEIRSPGDETDDKFDFYARLRVPEIWVVDRDSRSPEIHKLVGGQYDRVPKGSEGFVESPSTAVRLWQSTDRQLVIQLGDGDAA
jgi:Uma2 family endonuclease